MVDFKKLLDKDPRKVYGEQQRDCEFYPRCAPKAPVSTPVLETAFHRELADEAYQAALLDYVDEHWFV